jgi:hypothetical protein
MSSTNSENWADSGLRDMISFFSFNANKNYLYTETLLVHLSLQKKVDVIFLQKPPWRTIRYTPSATNWEGKEVTRPPLHHDWNVIYCKPDQLGNPRTMCYVHKRLVKFFIFLFFYFFNYIYLTWCSNAVHACTKYIVQVKKRERENWV